MTADFEPKLADFGQTRRGFGVGFSVVGHEMYRAPELCAIATRNYGKNAHWNEKADVFSYGILLWELLHKKIPYSDSHTDDVSKLVRNGHRPSFKSSNPQSGGLNSSSDGEVTLVCKKWRRLIKQCWAASPVERPTFQAILETIDKYPEPFYKKTLHSPSVIKEDFHEEEEIQRPRRRGRGRKRLQPVEEDDGDIVLPSFGDDDVNGDYDDDDGRHQRTRYGRHSNKGRR